MKRFFTYLIATAVILTGCKEHCEVDGVAVFELSQSEFQVANSGETVSVKVASKVNWTAETAEDWIKLKAEDIESVDGREADDDFASSIDKPFNSDRAGGYVTVEIEITENPTAAERNGEITFTTTDMQTFTVSVTQTAGTEDSIELDDMEGDDDFDKATKTLHFAAAGGEKTLGFTVTREWTAVVAEDAEWCSVEPESGNGGKVSITITAQPTEQFEERSTTVTITSGTASVTITVVQDGDPTIIPEDMERAFPDPIFRAYVMDKFDTDKDGKISKEEAEKVTQISVSKSLSIPDNEKIASLEGIQYFINLTTLYCQINKLTELDLTQNTALEYLNCSYNDLTELNVSQNTALTYLDCLSNQLTELDVTHNTALTRLSCSSNQLTTLDVSGCSALTYLSCYFNQLTKLDFSQNTTLTQLRCDSNQLTTLDVSQNPALTQLLCNDNQLTELDVTHNPALTDLRCGSNQLTTLDVTHNPALTRLDCEQNQLTELDITQNTALTYMQCSSNQLETLNVSGCSALTDLYCGSNQLTALDVTQNTALKILYCHLNQLTELYVTQNSALTDLWCNSNQLIELDVTQNTALTKLLCGSNQLTELNVTQNPALHDLSCPYNQLTELDITQNHALEDLYCYSNQLTTLDVTQNTALESLSCYSNQLTTLDVSKTNLGNSTEYLLLDCSPMNGSGLETLYLKEGWTIKYIYPERNDNYVPANTQILFKD